jgi:hypothetical protein
VQAGIHIERVGQRAKWRTATSGSPIAVTVSGGIVSLTDPQAAFHVSDVGSSIKTVFFADAGNNTTATVLSVSGTSTITFANAGGVAGSQTAGTYRIKPKAVNAAKRGGACMASHNEISGYGSVGIETLGCVAPEVTANIFNALVSAISEDGSVGPRIAHNREVTAGSNGARIRITQRTSWPFIDDNLITNGALAGQNLASDGVLAATRSDMGVGVDTATSIDYPLCGKRGRVKSTNGKPELVFAFGFDLVDGDQVDINGTTFVYKESAPGATQFNGMVFGAGSNTNQIGNPITKGLCDGDGGATTTGASRSGFTAEDYGTGLSGTPITGHVRMRTSAASATPMVGFVDLMDSLNPTALVVLRNDVGGGESICYTRGEGDAGPLAKRIVVWSPACQFTAGVMLTPDNVAAAGLASGGWYHEKAAQNAGCCEVIKTVTTQVGTEEFRWAIA